MKPNEVLLLLQGQLDATMAMVAVIASSEARKALQAVIAGLNEQLEKNVGQMPERYIEGMKIALDRFQAASQQTEQAIQLANYRPLPEEKN